MFGPRACSTLISVKNAAQMGTDRVCLCFACGYSVGELSLPLTCPECGTAYSSAPLYRRTLPQRLFRISSLAWIAAAPSIVIVFAIFIPKFFDAIEDDNPWAVELVVAAVFLAMSAALGVVFYAVNLALLVVVERWRIRTLSRIGYNGPSFSSMRTRSTRPDVLAIIPALLALGCQSLLIVIILKDWMTGTIVRLEIPWRTYWPLAHWPAHALAISSAILCVTIRVGRVRSIKRSMISRKG